MNQLGTKVQVDDIGHVKAICKTHGYEHARTQLAKAAMGRSTLFDLKDTRKTSS